MRTWLGVGALVACAVVLSGAVAHRPAVTSWPPPPQMMWCLAVSQIPSIPPGQSISAFVVPSDRYLVVTEASFGSSSIGAQLEERLAGVDTLKLDDMHFAGQVSSSFGLGVVFRPGAELVCRNTSAIAGSGYYKFIGYFVKS